MRHLTAAAFALVGILGTPAAVLCHPGSGIVIDRSGVVYFIDTGRGVWRLMPDGVLAEAGGPAFHWIALDESGRFKDYRARTPTAEMTTLRVDGGVIVLSSDFPVAIGRDGRLYYAPSRRDQPLALVAANPNGSTSDVVVLNDAVEPALQSINGIASAPDGALYVSTNDRVRRVAADGTITTIPGGAAFKECPPRRGEENLGPNLRGLVVDADRNVYVAVTACGAVLKISPRGAVSAILRADAPWSPTAVAVKGSEVFVLEYDHAMPERQWAPRVRKVDAKGTVTTLATVKR
jgi:sugar lactone lactonase YvrE